MLDGRGRPRCALFAEDGLHLSAAGYAVWATALREQVPWLAQPRMPSPVPPGNRAR